MLSELLKFFVESIIVLMNIDKNIKCERISILLHSAHVTILAKVGHIHVFSKYLSIVMASNFHSAKTPSVNQI